MINSFSKWKYIIIFMIIMIGIIYSLPSFYGKNPSVYISEQYMNKDSIINQDLLSKINKILENNKMVSKSIMLRSNQIIIQCCSKNDQIIVYKILSDFFSKKYLISFGFSSKAPSWLSIIQAKPINLGLDLCGGISLIIRMDTDIISKKFKKQYIDSIKQILFDRSIPYIAVDFFRNYDIEVCFQNSNDCDQAFLLLNKKNDFFVYAIDKYKLCVSLSKNLFQNTCMSAIKKNVEVLRYRISQLGISDLSIQRYGIDHIIIELPGFQDISKIKEVVNSYVVLEFRMVNTSINKFNIKNNMISEDSEIKIHEHGYLVPLYKKIILTGDCIMDSRVVLDEYGYPAVNLILNRMGSSIMSKFTKDNIGKSIATLLIEYQDSGKKNMMGHVVFTKFEKVINIATIQSHINKHFSIVGINNVNEARYLSFLLRMGSLAAPMYIEKEHIVSPILGSTNIKQGLSACILGIITSMCFMTIWYRFFGIISSFALFINLILIVSLMSLIPGMVLTLPNIAGIVLTLAVAVDANVLIYERIREEYKQGKPFQYAVYMGYRKAFSSICDANITTFIISIILYLIGTGLIQSFAIITIIGVGTSMFTSIVVTRAVVNLIYGKKNMHKLSI